jgi:flagellar motor switch protein FliN
MTPSIKHDGDSLMDQPIPGPAGADPGPIVEDSFASSRGLDSLLRVPVTLQVVLGSASLPVAQLMKLGRGAIVPLNHRVGEPVDVVVNGRIIARGEIVVVDEDNSRFGVSLTEIVGNNAGDIQR